MSVMEELYGEDGATAPVAETQPKPEAAPAPSEVQPDPAPVVPAETPAPAAPAEPQDPMAPVKALLDERERRQAAERRVAEFEARHREQEQKAREAAAKVPDPLEDPVKFARYLKQQQDAAVKAAYGDWQAQTDAHTEALSRNAMRRHLGAEQFGELEKFIGAAPDHAHTLARQSGDPYVWMHEKYEQAMKARKAEAALATLGDKPLEARIAEAVAAERAKWEAERGGGQPPAAVTPPADTRPRNPDGTFASPSQTQRHTPPSLSEVNGAAAVNGAERGSALQELYG